MSSDTSLQRLPQFSSFRDNHSLSKGLEHDAESSVRRGVYTAAIASKQAFSRGSRSNLLETSACEWIFCRSRAQVVVSLSILTKTNSFMRNTSNVSYVPHHHVLIAKTQLVRNMLANGSFAQSVPMHCNDRHERQHVLASDGSLRGMTSVDESRWPKASVTRRGGMSNRSVKRQDPSRFG